MPDFIEALMEFFHLLSIRVDLLEKRLEELEAKHDREEDSNIQQSESN